MRKYLFDFTTAIVGDRVVVTHPTSAHTYTFQIFPGGALQGSPVIDAPPDELAYAQSRVVEAFIAARDAKAENARRLNEMTA